VSVWRTESSEPRDLEPIEINSPATSTVGDLLDLIVAALSTPGTDETVKEDIRLSDRALLYAAKRTEGSLVTHADASHGWRLIVDGEGEEERGEGEAHASDMLFDSLFEDSTRFWFLSATDKISELDATADRGLARAVVHAYILPSRALDVTIVDFGEPSDYRTVKSSTVAGRAKDDVVTNDKGERYVWWSESSDGFQTDPTAGIARAGSVFAAGIYRIPPQTRLLVDVASSSVEPLAIVMQAQTTLLQSFVTDVVIGDRRDNVVCFERCVVGEDPIFKSVLPNDERSYAAIVSENWENWSKVHDGASLERCSHGGVLIACATEDINPFFLSLGSVITDHLPKDVWVFARSSCALPHDKRDVYAHMQEGQVTANYSLKPGLCRRLHELAFYCTLAAPPVAEQLSRNAHPQTWVVVHYQVITTSSGITSPTLPRLAGDGSGGASARRQQPRKRDRGDESPHNDDPTAVPADPKSRRQSHAIEYRDGGRAAGESRVLEDVILVDDSQDPTVVSDDEDDGEDDDEDDDENDLPKPTFKTPSVRGGDNGVNSETSRKRKAAEREET
jgi:hypothetical protein